MLGVSLMTREHILLTLILKIPFIFVVTKVDLAPNNILNQTLKDIDILLKRYKCYGNLKCIENYEEFCKLKNIDYKKDIPYIKVSNSTGHNIDLARNYLRNLDIYKDWKQLKNNNTKFTVEDVY